MLLITGEELASGQSTLARAMVIELSKDDINLKKLTAIQEKSKLLPHAMCSYISWVRENMEIIGSEFEKAFINLRHEAHTESIHARLPEQCASLQFTLHTALHWMLDKGILTEENAGEIDKEAWNALMAIYGERRP